MSDDERSTVAVTSVLLLGASLVRFAWELRPVPSLLPESPIPAALVEETRAAVEREQRMATPLAPGERIDPNRAPDVELARLPGVGPALAARIVEARETGGPFRDATDLDRVSGIGPATLARIAPSLDFSNPPPRSTASTRLSPPSAGPRIGALPAASGARGALPSPRPPPSSQGLDINRAAEADLQALPGIGPALAARIVEHRARVGRFANVDDLMDVSGIGPATLERLRPLVRAGP